MRSRTLTAASIIILTLLVGWSGATAPPSVSHNAGASGGAGAGAAYDVDRDFALLVARRITTTAPTTTAQKPRVTRKASKAIPGSRTPVAPGAGSGPAVLACIRSYEGAYTTNTGNGYYGAYQFDQGTWDSNVGAVGYGEWVGRRAHEAPPSVQDDAAWHAYSTRGLQPWGNAARANCRWPNLHPKGS